ncbi:MAG: GTPase ObgE [Myxococcales bacterium FL481]|nr:MAG: GTPase ObgE [Myxococcales bacterium FL481]
MRFIDRARVHVHAGDGGDGVVAWRREALVPRGGPAGGDGGRGGDVYFEADGQLSTLLELRYRKVLRAGSGAVGGSKSKHGRGAEDLVVRVPVGTDVFYEGHEEEDESAWGSTAALANGTEAELTDGEDDALFEIDGIRRLPPRARKTAHDHEVGERIGELSEPGQRLLVARGGLGGRGNIHFRSSTNRAPRMCEQGGVGERCVLRLELRLLADVGIVGFPNVGKSTLISQISRARPEIADYPFTTLEPQLGVVSLPHERVMVVADVPGLIEGAAEGKGLGHDFLRHLERTRVLLHVLAPDPTPGRVPLDDLEVLERELNRYGPMFRGRPRVVALNKLDTPEGQALLQETRQVLRGRQIPLFPICATTGEGVPALLEAIWRRLEMVRRRESASQG